MPGEHLLASCGSAASDRVLLTNARLILIPRDGSTAHATHIEAGAIRLVHLERVGVSKSDASVDAAHQKQQPKQQHSQQQSSQPQHPQQQQQGGGQVRAGSPNGGHGRSVAIRITVAPRTDMPGAESVTCVLRSDPAASKNFSLFVEALLHVAFPSCVTDSFSTASEEALLADRATADALRARFHYTRDYRRLGVLEKRPACTGCDLRVRDELRGDPTVETDSPQADMSSSMSAAGGGSRAGTGSSWVASLSSSTMDFFSDRNQQPHPSATTGGGAVVSLARLRFDGPCDRCGSGGWRISTVNEGFDVCPSYPEQCVVPARLGDIDVADAATFRAKGRWPVFAWACPSTGAVLLRGSQPSTGVGRSRSITDEVIIQAARLAGGPDAKLLIMDARPLTNALANMIGGGGYEALENYPECELEFAGLANVHAVRSSHARLVQLLRHRVRAVNKARAHERADLAASSMMRESVADAGSGNQLKRSMLGRSGSALGASSSAVGQTLGSSTSHLTAAPGPSAPLASSSSSSFITPSAATSRVRAGSGVGHESTEELLSSWLGNLQSTGWPSLVMVLLSAANRCKRALLTGTSVLVHCSDGWDRTPQISSVAQVLLDPFYRTAEGFCLLVEKEWVAQGHRFASRLGAGIGSVSGDTIIAAPQSVFGDAGAVRVVNRVDDTSSESSPVFLLFLEAIFNIVIQCPTEFEFTDRLLLGILRGVHTHRFRAFLTDAAIERRDFPPTGGCPLWQYLQTEAGAEELCGGTWHNPFYEGSTYTGDGAGHDSVPLTVDVTLKAYRLWSAVHECRPGTVGSHELGDAAPLVAMARRTLPRRRRRSTHKPLSASDQDELVLVSSSDDLN